MRSVRESIHPVLLTNNFFTPFVQEGDYRYPMVAMLQRFMVAACMQVNFQPLSQHLSVLQPGLLLCG